MTRKEVEDMRLADMLDLIACLSVYKGAAVEKHRPKKMSYDEFMALT